MRVFLQKKVKFKILYLKKIIAIFIITIMIGILLSGFFSQIYKPYITSIAIGRTNNYMQKLTNETVLETIKATGYKTFVNIIKNKDDKIIGIETDAVKINCFQAEFLKNIAEKLKNIQNENFAIPILAFLNNPFLSEIGPAIHIKVRPVGILSNDIENTFVAVGVNQSKHQIDMKIRIGVVIVMPAMKIEHTVSSVVPVAQTVIVGDVPQSYTNVTTTSEKLDDTVLQLAEN